jgi:hypothetical protein
MPSNSFPDRYGKTTKVYRGFRDPHGNAKVTVNGKPLNPRFDLENHSPTGFEWGYGGSGPAQLALALLADALRSGKKARKLHQRFKRKVTARICHDANWELSDRNIRTIVSDLEDDNA